MQEIFTKIDHTNLDRQGKWEDIKILCDEAVKYNAASVCIQPCYVEEAKKYVGNRMKICTVIGFPNGYNTKETKVFETEDALLKGADEIDMVINICHLKDRKFDIISDEIKSIKKVCGDKVLKVIVETCLLTEEEKIKMCHIVTDAGADFIKTSTGFSTGGATLEDIKLFKENVGENVKIKAAGSISDISFGEKLISQGADRLGSSRIIKNMR